MSVWWREHADYHMAVLMDKHGPFAAAEGTQTKKGDPLPMRPLHRDCSPMCGSSSRRRRLGST
ncbi:DUF4913 domain-containing protein [Georgenia satyanarayanai]|uniref:DUF4913 domain-containing protein n=1 Tax=Georgenia satyanarayanai TaxID=860221 RepID=UPI00204236D3|nr:DUF4913 domain-containing protein [Georgenia satyanarayanai]MCM3662532.1 DUF4913 domain-containing protein [Georgenia satyanarayanai]